MGFCSSGLLSKWTFVQWAFVLVGFCPSGLLSYTHVVHVVYWFCCKLFTAPIGSVYSLFPSEFIYCVNLHQFLILCSSKARLAKCWQISIFAMPVAFTGNYREILANSGKYWQILFTTLEFLHSTFRLVISIIETIIREYLT